MSEVRGLISEDRWLRADVRWQRMEIGDEGQKSEVGRLRFILTAKARSTKRECAWRRKHGAFGGMVG